MRIAILTSRSARHIIERLVAGRSNVYIVDLPVHAISFLDARSLEKLLARRPDVAKRLSAADIVLAPGSVRGDLRGVSRLIGKPVWKASRSPALLPAILDYLSSGGELSPEVSAEELVSKLEPDLPESKVAFSIGNVGIPLRGPPLVLAAEVPPGLGVEDTVRQASRMARDGASLIVIGVGFDEDPRVVSRKVEAVAGSVDTPVLSEAPTRGHAEAALSAGAHGIIVSSPSIEWALEVLPAGAALVIGDSDLGGLEASVRRALQAGVTRVVADPVLGLPLLGLLDSLERIKKASSRLNVPFQFTAANAVEEMSGDTHGVHAVMAVLAVESGASIYYVVEDSYKSYRGVSEAKEALRVAQEAYRLKVTPRYVPSRLYVVKQPSEPENHNVGGSIKVDCVEPQWDRKGYIRIWVDHARGVIVAEYRSYTGKVLASVEGNHGPSVARELARRARLDPDHAVYLGYEISKAEIALALGKSYTQDEPVIIPVWGWSVEEGGRIRTCEDHNSG